MSRTPRTHANERPARPQTNAPCLHTKTPEAARDDGEGLAVREGKINNRLRGAIACVEIKFRAPHAIDTTLSP